MEAGNKIAAAIHGALQDFPPVGVSVGVAWFERVDRSFDAMLKAADQLMYEVKDHGKGSVHMRRISPIIQDGRPVS